MSRKIRAYSRKVTMANRSVKAMLSRMKLTDEAVGVAVVNNGQGIITIDGFAQLKEKYVEGLWQVLRRPGVNTGGYPILVLQC